MRSPLFLALAVVPLMGCGSSENGDVSGASGAPSSSAGAPSGNGGASSSAGAPGNAGRAGGTGGSPNGSSGGSSAGGSSPTPGGDAGTGGVGSSGAPNGTGGNSACCSTGSCQPAPVRTCVCTEWLQNQCCTGDWDTFCQVTAVEKCQAESCEPPPGPDGGTSDKGPCCSESSSPGCNEPAVEQCVCALLPDCCTNAWDAICVQLVREKHCEPGVRACVCTDWQQGSCCDTQWTTFCGITAEEKCGARPSCP